MRINSEAAQSIWLPILVRLSELRSEYDIKGALQTSGGIRRGSSAEEMLEELRHAIHLMERDGLIQTVKRESVRSRYFGITFDNTEFYFTDAFRSRLQVERTQVARAEKKAKRWENWTRPLLIGLGGGGLGGVITWFITESLLK